jgi:hypothetical protein
MNTLSRIGILIAFAAFLPLDSNALSLETTNPALVASFQTGATIENFDNLAALTITSYAAGQTVPAADQFSSRNLASFTSPVYNSGGASFNDPIGKPTSNPGTPIGIFAPSGPIAGDVKSGTNVAGPLVVGSSEAFNNGFMEVIFPTNVQLVGFWITHASGPLTMFLKDSTNMNLSTGDFQVTGNQGEFIGIQRSSPDVRGITIGFTESFTIDDFTFSAAPATTVPDTSFTAGLLGISLAGLIYFARRRTATVV